MNAKSAECWGNDPEARALRVELSADRSLLLPFDQFLLAELTTEGKEQRLRLVFATHEILVQGNSLRRIETAMQRLELSHLARLPASYRSATAENQPIVREIIVTESQTRQVHPEQEP